MTISYLTGFYSDPVEQVLAPSPFAKRTTIPTCLEYEAIKGYWLSIQSIYVIDHENLLNLLLNCIKIHAGSPISTN